MAKKYIPQSGDKFKVFVLVPAFQGKVFLCTGKCFKNHRICVKAKDLTDLTDEKPLAFNRQVFDFEEVKPK